VQFGQRRLIGWAVNALLRDDRGVTSNAGLRAAKRPVTSAGSRSSIGMSAPLAVSRSTVELGATT
jgi:hypothetical protein